MSGAPRRGNAWALGYALAGGVVGCVAEALGAPTGTLVERRGAGPALPAPVRPLWFHGASVGEIVAIEPLVAAARARMPGLDWGMTTTSTTGRRAARERLPGARFHRLLPLDAWPALDRFLDRVHPGAVVIVETEIWPRLLGALAAREVPVCLASARVTKAAFERYRRARGLFAPLLASLTLVAARTDADRDRLVALGTDPERTLVLGNTKLDEAADAPNGLSPERAARLGALAAGRPVVVFGSLRGAEESLAMDAIARVSARAEALWVLAPRHRAGFDRTASALSRRRVSFARWSDPTGGNDRPQALLLDTIGDLARLWRHADVAVVGGTFARYGGHNLMEPARQGVPVLFGPDTSSWPEDADDLASGGGGHRVDGAVELAATIVRLLASEAERAGAARAARKVSLAGRGASARIVDALSDRSFFARVTSTSPAP